jgi:hypothetical protein
VVPDPRRPAWFQRNLIEALRQLKAYDEYSRMEGVLQEFETLTGVAVAEVYSGGTCLCRHCWSFLRA